MAQWPGIFVRCNFGQDGNVPRSTSSGSPDILIWQNRPVEDPNVFTDPANYDYSWYNMLNIGSPNYIYIRGKNFTNGALDGVWNLFYATQHTVLYPWLWEQLKTSRGDQNPAFAIAAGKIGASTECFVWVPPDSYYSYTLIAIANTPGHGNPLAGVNYIASLDETLANNGNIAMRVTYAVQYNGAEYVEEVPYYHDDETSTVDLVVTFENIPTRSFLQFGSGTLLNGRTLYLSQSQTEANNFELGWKNLTIPANWYTTFTLDLRFSASDWSGIPPGQHPSCTISTRPPQSNPETVYHLGSEAEPHPVTNEIRRDATGAPIRSIEEGSVKMELPENKPE